MKLVICPSCGNDLMYVNMLIEVKKENEKAWKLIKNRKCCTITAFTSILPTRNYPILPQIEIAKISTNLTF